MLINSSEKNAADVVFSFLLCLPHHCDKGEQCRDDSFLVHFTFLKFKTTSEFVRCQVIAFADSLCTSYS